MAALTELTRITVHQQCNLMLVTFYHIHIVMGFIYNASENCVYF